MKITWLSTCLANRFVKRSATVFVTVAISIGLVYLSLQLLSDRCQPWIDQMRRQNEIAYAHALNNSDAGAVEIRSEIADDSSNDLLPLPKSVAQTNLHPPSEIEIDWEQSSWFDNFFCDVKVSDAAIAFFTLFLVIAGAWQGYQMVVGNTIAVRDSEISNRAYITIGIKGLDDCNIGAKPTANVVFHNVGRTPAYRFVGTSSICFDTFPLPESFSFARGPIKPGEEPREITLSPEKEFRLRPTMLAALGNVHLTEWQAGKAALYVHGEFKFLDAFGKERISEFCYVYRFVDVARNSPGIYPLHNRDT